MLGFYITFPVCPVLYGEQELISWTDHESFLGLECQMLVTSITLSQNKNRKRKTAMDALTEQRDNHIS